MNALRATLAEGNARQAGRAKGALYGASVSDEPRFPAVDLDATPAMADWLRLARVRRKAAELRAAGVPERDVREQVRTKLGLLDDVHARRLIDRALAD